MSRAIEYINAANLRLDGRRPHETRRVAINLGGYPEADGSATYAIGGTKVLALVFGPREGNVGRSMGGGGSSSLSNATFGGSSATVGVLSGTSEAMALEATVACNVAFVAFAGERRRNPASNKKQSQELSATVESVARSVLCLSQYPMSHIHIYIEVLQQDGSEKAACVNAAIMALADASIAMHDSVIAMTAGVIDNKIILDLTNQELRSQCPNLLMVVNSHQTEAIVLFEMDSRVSEEALERMVKEVSVGAKKMYEEAVDPVLRAHVTQMWQVKQQQM